MTMMCDRELGLSTLFSLHILLFFFFLETAAFAMHSVCNLQLNISAPVFPPPPPHPKFFYGLSEWKGREESFFFSFFFLLSFLFFAYEVFRVANEVKGPFGRGSLLM